MKAARRKYTPEEKAEALRLYQTEGPTEAGKATGIDKSLIRKWAKKVGLSTVATEKMKEARAAAQEKNEQRIGEIKIRLINRIIDLDKRIDRKHKEFKGQLAKEVWYDEAPSDAVKAYATSMAILIDKYQVLTGGKTGSEQEFKFTIDIGAMNGNQDPDKES